MVRRTATVLSVSALLLAPVASAAAAPSAPVTALSQSAACAVPASHDVAVTSAVHAVGVQRGVSEKVMLAAFEAGWVESHMHNLDCGHSDSLGVFQQRPSQGWGTPAQVLDPVHAANAFFAEAQRVEASYAGSTAGQLAQGVQRSAYPERYDQSEAEALAMLAELR